MATAAEGFCMEFMFEIGVDEFDDFCNVLFFQVIARNA